MMEILLPDFDLAVLLAPIADEAPAGVDLREDFSPQSLYYRLRDARADARAAERAADAESQSDAVPPQWRSIRDLAFTALASHSKDLEIAAWLTESLLRSDGLAGLQAGAALMAGLVEGFWEQLYPMPDEDGIATRVAPLGGLNGMGGDGTLIQPLRKLALYNRPDGAPMALWQYEQSAELAGIGDAARRQQRLDAGVLPFDTAQSEAQAARASMASLRDRAAAALAAWNALATALDTHAGSESPPASRVRDILARILDITQSYAGAPAASAPAAADGTADGTAGTAEAAAGVAPRASEAAGTAMGRETALRQLDELAAFFRRTEPHSPLAYTLSEAARRGRMSWAELMQEIVPDASQRAGILTSLGIRPEREENS
jgi:type VI secretion system protein ImpA